MRYDNTESKDRIMEYYVYILRTVNNRLYIGQTKDLENRLKQHKCHTGAKFIKDNYDFYLVYKEIFNSRLDSMKREKQLKGWTRAKKETLISK